MERSELQKRINRANSVPMTAGKVIWLYPMLIFWGAAFGPLKPLDYPAVDTAPRLPGFLLGLGVCLVPYLLPRSSNRSRNRARARRCYEALGVRGFKRFVVNGDLVNRRIRRHDPGYRVLVGRTALRDLLEGTWRRERHHLVLLLMGMFAALYAVRIGWYGWAIVLTLGNVVFNLYSVWLQRYNRARIVTILEGTDRAG